ncbi:MAG TPA: peptidylprolyl isomerase [Bacteroidales bacterium]|nr:peptidylprolyl isomerase [Bacteroidales bacterium]
MTITKDKVVSVSYQLRATDGELIESVDTSRPFMFLYGVGNMIPKFEENLAGMKEGSKFDFVIVANEAYGPVNDDAIVELPTDIFKVDGVIDEDLLIIGNTVPMQDPQGHKFNGIVKALGENSVTMDFNHPLAGVDLHFTGEVFGIREATEEELSHGHIHGAGGHDHGHDHGGCGCGDGGCNDDSCGCEDEKEESCGSGCGCH